MKAIHLHSFEVEEDKGIEGCGIDLFQGTIPEFGWRA
jgi:hypothetical protein